MEKHTQKPGELLTCKKVVIGVMGHLIS